jgi:outer membrane cobalamin receptor
MDRFVPRMSHAESPARRAAAPLILALALLAGALHPPDSVAQGEAAAPADSLPPAPRDTVRLGTVRMVGAVEPSIDSVRTVTEADIPWTDNRYAGDLVGRAPGITVREQSSEGQYSELIARGAGWRSVALLRNGLPLNDPASGVANTWDLPLRDVERVEVITGPRGFLYGLNSAGATINVVTKNYTRAVPFTRVYYTQGPSLFGDFDALFSQNLYRDLNILLALEAITTDGRYLNSAMSGWHARAKVRYEAAPGVQLILSEQFTSSQTELNGGINPAATSAGEEFEPIGAVPVNADTYDKITRHGLDLTLHANFLGDSASPSLVSVYYNNSLREYRDEESVIRTNGITVTHDHRSSWTGVLVQQTVALGSQRLSAGGTIELRQIEGSPTLGRRRGSATAAWAKAELVPVDGLEIGIFGRADGTLDFSGGGIGADARVTLADGLALFGGVSRSLRYPTFTELYWTDSTVSRAGPIVEERHLLAEAGLQVTLQDLGWLWIAAFLRRIEDPITTSSFRTGSPFPGVEFSNGAVLESYGGEFRFLLRPWLLEIDGTGRLMVQRQSGVDPRSMPAFLGDASVSIKDSLLDGALRLKAGLRGRFATAHRGMQFTPEVLAYVPSSGRDLGGWAAVDLVVRAGIGDAVVHFTWENLTGADYYSSAFYPGYARGIRLGLTWDFLN